MMGVTQTAWAMSESSLCPVFYSSYITAMFKHILIIFNNYLLKIGRVYIIKPLFIITFNIMELSQNKFRPLKGSKTKNK